MNKNLIVILLVMMFFLTLPVFATSVVELSELLNPEQMLIHQGYLYVSENFSIKIFNLSDGKLINTFGKKGEGPGEFKIALFMVSGKDFILANSSGKVSLFTLRGNLIKEVKVKGMVPKYKPTLEGFVAQSNKKLKDRKIEPILGLFNNNFQLIKELHKSLPINNGVYTSKNKGTYEIIANYFNYKTMGDKIFLGNTKQGFLIKVFDNKGNFLYDIKQNYLKREIEESVKEKYLNLQKQKPEYKFLTELFNFTFPKYYPAFKNMMLNDNKIYIETFITKENKVEFLTLDIKGKQLTSNFLPVTRILKDQDPLYCFYEGNYYFLKENIEKDIWELHKIKL